MDKPGSYADLKAVIQRAVEGLDITFAVEEAATDEPITVWTMDHPNRDNVDVNVGLMLDEDGTPLFMLSLCDHDDGEYIPDTPGVVIGNASASWIEPTLKDYVLRIARGEF